MTRLFTRALLLPFLMSSVAGCSFNIDVGQPLATDSRDGGAAMDESDPCEANDLYSDGVCDTDCLLPDPDCEGDPPEGEDDAGARDAPADAGPEEPAEDAGNPGAPDGGPAPSDGGSGDDAEDAGAADAGEDAGSEADGGAVSPVDGGAGDDGGIPDEWLCPIDYYGTGDGCDCGCGIRDPDCSDSVVLSIDDCEYAPRCGGLENLNEHYPTHCAAPTCPENAHLTPDLEHCECDSGYEPTWQGTECVEEGTAEPPPEGLECTPWETVDAQGDCVAAGPVFEGSYEIENFLDVQDLAGYVYITGSLKVSAPGLSSLPLGALRAVGHDLEISGNTDMSAVNLSGLRWVGGDLVFDRNEAVTELSLPELIQVDGDLEIGARVLTYVTPTSLFHDGRNEALTTVSAPALKAVGGELLVSKNGGFDGAFGGVHGLDYLDFGALRYVGNDLLIEANVALTAFDLSSLESVATTAWTQEVSFWMNLSLPACAPDRLAEQLADAGYTGDFYNEGNDGTGGCY